MDNIFLHPDLKLILKQWLKAKVFDQGLFHQPESGTPQGGIISPTLANFTLNGLEATVNQSIFPLTRSIEQRKQIKQIKQIKLRDGRKTRIALNTATIRYADDFVIITKSKNILTKYIQPAVDIFLKERGLWLSPHKTKTFKLTQKGAQLDFLGYTFKYQSK